MTENIGVIQKHYVVIKEMLDTINDHIDVIEQHGGEVKIWKHPTSNKWQVRELKLDIMETK